MAKYKLIDIGFMLTLTTLIAMFAYYMPEYYGHIKTMAYVMMVFSAIVSLRIAGKVSH